jgi:hypothetical protein
MRGAVTVTGTVLEVERRKGSFDNDRGENIQYDYTLATVLCGSKVVEVKFRNDRPDAQPPAEGAEIALEVEVPKGIKVIAKGYQSDGIRKAS